MPNEIEILKNDYMPTQDFLLVARLNKPKQTESGILLLQENQKLPETGVVLVTGPGKTVKNNILPMSVKHNDTILFERGTGINVKLEDKWFVVLSENEVLGVIED